LQELGKNPAFGFDKLRNQAERGTAEDKYKLAMRFLYGDKDVPKDIREAIVWLKKAAYTDDSKWAADAAYQLGDLTENTKGYFEKVFTDGKDKKYWTNLAASKGHSGAQSWANERDIESRKRIEDERNTRVLEEAIRRSRK
jgi:TPR repeat protein